MSSVVVCSVEASDILHQVCSEVSRVLAPGTTCCVVTKLSGGVFLCFTLGNRDTRMPYFDKEEYSWSISVEVIPLKASQLHCFCMKVSDSASSPADNLPDVTQQNPKR